MLDIALNMPRKNRVTVLAKRGDDVVLMETVGQGDGKGWRAVAKALKTEESYLLGHVLKVTAESPVTFTLEETTESSDRQFDIWTRAERQSRESATHLPGIAEALVAPGEFIEWNDREALCCLDIDYHGKTAPPADWLLATVARLRPLPKYHWITRGGGLHLLYERVGYLTADELAAVAGLCWLHYDRLATFELLKHTRKPTGEVYTSPASTDLGFVAKYLGADMDEERVDQWLVENDYARGTAYDHSRCPVWPDAESHAMPVFIQDAGIYCHKCEAAGKTLGAKRPGFFPFTALIGGGPSTTIRTMCGRFCHWDHARLVLEDSLGLVGPLAKLCWRALLHLVHGDDVRVERAMTAGDDLIRLDGRWMTRNAIKPWTKDIRNVLEELPACQGPEGTVRKATVDRFLQSISLAEYGYANITPIYGCRIYSHYLSLADERITVVAPAGRLATTGAQYADRLPKYVPGPRRDLGAAWAVIEEAFPGLDRNYLLLLLAAKGVSEGQPAMPPNLLVSGYTSSGKTTTIHLAAAIAGDNCSELTFGQSADRFRQHFFTKATEGTYIAVNELLKDAERLGHTPVQAMDPFLNLNRNSVNHQLWVGSVSLGCSPVTVVTDIQVPQDLRNDLQIARRFIYVQLKRSVDWRTAPMKAGIPEAEALRTRDRRFCEAANTILSHVIDTWFREPRNLVDIAADLGYSTLDQAENFEDPTVHLKELYNLVRLQAESTDRQWVGGWRVIRRREETQLAGVWSVLCDGDSGVQWGSSRRVAEQDWTRLLNSRHQIHCETRRHGDMVGIRFVEERENVRDQDNPQ